MDYFTHICLVPTVGVMMRWQYSLTTPSVILVEHGDGTEKKEGILCLIYKSFLIPKWK